MVTLKYDPTGKLSWATNYFGPETNVQPVAITFDADGNICVSGISSDHGPTLALVKYDPQGNQLSAQQLNSDPPIQPRRWIMDSARNILLVGNYGTGWATTKLDGQGKQLWFVRYPGVSVWGSYVADVTTDCAGHIFVTGTSLTQPCAPECYGTHLFTLKYDPNGHLLWMAQSCQMKAFGWPSGVKRIAIGLSHR